jgi:hypothetical protein
MADSSRMLAIDFGMDHAALQQRRGTIAPAPSHPDMSARKPSQYFIHGITADGKTFRPSDWAERLAGVMSRFRPEGSSGGMGAHIGYSPYCVPRLVDGVKCVLVNEALRDIEPMAWDFVMNFAKDNGLQVRPAGPETKQGSP